MNSSSPQRKRYAGNRWALLLVGGALLASTGCGGLPEIPLPALGGILSDAPPDESKVPTATVQEPGQIKYYPSDEPLRMGMEHFSRGDYGLAQRYFRDAVEKAPKDATAWIGLAASYDRVRRFDLADGAYAAAIKLTGETVQILNNEGYSYMLRGNLTKARAKFLKAYELDPTNPTITNNLELLNASQQFIRRPPE